MAPSGTAIAPNEFAGEAPLLRCWVGLRFEVSSDAIIRNHNMRQVTKKGLRAVGIVFASGREKHVSQIS